MFKFLLRAFRWPLVASPSAAPGARLNEIVTDGKLALMIDRQAARVPDSKCVNALSGTALPEAELHINIIQLRGIAAGNPAALPG